MTIYIWLPVLNVGLNSHAIMITIIFMIFLSIQSGILQSLFAKIFSKPNQDPCSAKNSSVGTQQAEGKDFRMNYYQPVQKRRAFSLDEKLMVGNVSFIYEVQGLAQVGTKCPEMPASKSGFKKAATRNYPALAVMKTIHIDIPPNAHNDELKNAEVSTVVNEIRVFVDKIRVSRVPVDLKDKCDLSENAEVPGDGPVTDKVSASESRRSKTNASSRKWKSVAIKRRNTVGSKTRFCGGYSKYKKQTSVTLKCRRCASAQFLTKRTCDDQYCDSAIASISRSLFTQSSLPHSKSPPDEGFADEHVPSSRIEAVQDSEYADLLIDDDWILIDRFHAFPTMNSEENGANVYEPDRPVSRSLHLGEMCPIAPVEVAEAAVQTDEKDFKLIQPEVKYRRSLLKLCFGCA